MARLRAAVSGLRHGRTHCRAYADDPDYELAGLFDPDPERLRACREAHPGAIGFAGFEEMLARARPDVVSIASPEFAHAEQAEAALSAGAHVLLEKAMADSLDGVERILRAVERSGRLLYVGQEVRLTPAFLDARRLLLAGRLGRVYQAESCYLHNIERLCLDGQWRGDPARAHPTALSGGCHPVDLLRSLLGEVREVCARATHWNKEISPFEDCTSMLLEFESGAVGSVVVATSTRRPYLLKLHLNGTAGYLEADNSGAPSRLALAPPLEEAAFFREIPSRHDSHDCASQVRNLASAILRGQALIVDAWEGANSTAVCLAAVEAARTGRPVRPRRFTRPDTVRPPAEPLEVLGWRGVEALG